MPVLEFPANLNFVMLMKFLLQWYCCVYVIIVFIRKLLA